MPFKEVPNTVDFVAQEHGVLQFWQESGAFNKLRALRSGGPRFSFTDGPITANNPMGVHHAWGRTYKDLFLRYKAMQGFDQRWQNGFDCQGLWVEVNVEKELGFESKRDIEEYGLAEFVKLCKQRGEPLWRPCRQHINNVFGMRCGPAHAEEKQTQCQDTTISCTSSQCFHRSFLLILETFRCPWPR